MLQYNFQVFFIFLLYNICAVQIKNGTTQEIETKNATSFSIQKCEFRCSCENFRRLPGVICQNMTDYLMYLPMYGNNTLDSIYELKFTDIIHLPARIFQRLNIYRLIVDDLAVTIDENVFEGINGLYRFNVQRSSIEFRRLPGVICQNMTDYLMYLPMYGNNTLDSIYELKFTDIIHLPARIFQRLNIYRLIVDDLAVTIDENVFEGINGLYRFNVQRSSIEVIPNFRFVKETVASIDIDRSRLTSLEGNNLQNLSSVKELSFFNNYISYVCPDVFKHTENVESLDLSRNLLTYISPEVLSPLKNLIFFYAGYNNLLHIDNLFSITRPRFIHLIFNNITDARFALLDVATMKNIKERLSEGDGRQFSCEKINVQYADFLPIATIDMLDLSHNSIREPSGSYLPCHLRAFDFNFRIKHFNMNRNKLEKLRNFLVYSRIDRVQLARNKIQFLAKEDFTLINGIAHLELHDNEIKRIDTDTFKLIRMSMRSLVLNSNLITSLNGSVKYLAELRLLSLAHNSIQSFATDEFVGVNALSEVFLQYNQIKTIEQLQNLPQLTYLNIKQNDIKLITPDQVPKTLRSMDLAGNPFECNCRLQPFILGLKENSFRTDIGICLQSNINSLHKKSNCPGMCSCGCKNDGNISFIFADCSSKNLSAVPQFPRGNFTETEIISNYRRPFIVNQNVYSTFDIEDVVLGINLQNNNLGFLDVDQLPPHLIELYLSNNKLRMLPETIFEIQNNVKHASLSGNPWKCDCKATKFKKWLTSKKDFIQDIDNVRCEVSDKEEAELNGKIIWKLTDIDLCSTDIALAVSASFGVLSLVIFCLASKVLYTKYELNIKVFLYSHGFIFLKDEDQNYDKIFDAFVSFSHNDDEFVIKEIISEIENKDPNIHLCLPYRHFLPGKLIQDNITEAVRNSKMTIVILSSNFLDSEWCLLEFRTAHEQSMKDKVHRIIVIKLGELPEKIDSLVKAYIVNTTYLEWGEKNFWNKLIYVLPSRNSAISQVSRSAGNIDFVLSRPFSDLFEL